MIKSLYTDNLGLDPGISVEWASRLNLITGDNGLGKSFLLDLSWWALTGTWAGLPVTPAGGLAVALIEFELMKPEGRTLHKSLIAPNGEEYESAGLRPVTDSVVVYVRAMARSPCGTPTGTGS